MSKKIILDIDSPDDINASFLVDWLNDQFSRSMITFKDTRASISNSEYYKNILLSLDESRRFQNMTVSSAFQELRDNGVYNGENK